jgi:hypothetical protein
MRASANTDTPFGVPPSARSQNGQNLALSCIAVMQGVDMAGLVFVIDGFLR